MKTLVLSDGWVPMAIVPWQRAITLVFDGKATVVQESASLVHSPTRAMAIPAVIAFKRGSRPHKKAIKFSRENIAIRDGWKCQYCLQSLSLGQMTYDHVLPRSKGGKTEWTNVVACCYACNQRKSNRTPQEANMRVVSPVRPKTLPNLFRMEWDEGMPVEWQPYLQSTI